MDRVWCFECSEWFELDGPNGVLIHAIAFHPTSPFAQRIMRELARLPLLVR